jgi:hypothetical protein
VVVVLVDLAMVVMVFQVVQEDLVAVLLVLHQVVQLLRHQVQY